MKKNSLLMCALLACVACDPASTPSPKEPKEPKMMQNAHPIGLTPQDDIILVVNPGWKPAHETPLTQSLRANPVEKEHLNVNIQPNQKLDP